MINNKKSEHHKEYDEKRMFYLLGGNQDEQRDDISEELERLTLKHKDAIMRGETPDEIRALGFTVELIDADEAENYRGNGYIFDMDELEAKYADKDLRENIHFTNEDIQDLNEVSQNMQM